MDCIGLRTSKKQQQREKQQQQLNDVIDAHVDATPGKKKKRQKKKKKKKMVSEIGENVQLIFESLPNEIQMTDDQKALIASGKMFS